MPELTCKMDHSLAMTRSKHELNVFLAGKVQRTGADTVAEYEKGRWVLQDEAQDDGEDENSVESDKAAKRSSGKKAKAETGSESTATSTVVMAMYRY